MATASSSGSNEIRGGREQEDELDRLALEEILKETKRGKERAETMGPMGWGRLYKRCINGYPLDNLLSNGQIYPADKNDYLLDKFIQEVAAPQLSLKNYSVKTNDFWIKCPLQQTNKRFFRNILKGTLASSREKSTVTKDLNRREKRSLNVGKRTFSSYDRPHSDRQTCSQTMSTPGKSSSTLLIHQEPGISSNQSEDKKREICKNASSNCQHGDIRLHVEKQKSRKHKIKHSSNDTYKKKRKS